jgi:hypothetical protein
VAVGRGDDKGSALVSISRVLPLDSLLLEEILHDLKEE